jgi:hypothetical protein
VRGVSNIRLYPVLMKFQGQKHAIFTDLDAEVKKFEQEVGFVWDCTFTTINSA